METPDQPEDEEQIETPDYINDCINISLGLYATNKDYKTKHITSAIDYIDKVKNCYEVLFNDVNRVYGDVDFKDVDKAFETAGQPYTVEAFNTQDKIYKDALVSTIEWMLESIGRPKNQYALYTASKYDCKKISWRFVLTTLTASKRTNKMMMEGANDTFQANQNRYTTINNTILSFDTSIYSKGQKMRMVGTSKPGEERPLVMVKGQVLDSFISYIDENCKNIPEPAPEPEIAYTSNSITNNATLSELSDLLELLPKKYLETIKGSPTVKYGALQIIGAILNSFKISPELRDVILKYIPRPNNRADINWVNEAIRRYTPPAPGVKPLTVATLYYLIEDKDKLQQLRNKYKKTYYKEIVGYTLPNDWDLLDNHQDENGYLRDIPVNLTSVLVESHLGTGKTTQIKKLIKGQTKRRFEPLKLVKSKAKAEPIKQSSILVICPRITFSESMYQDYGVENDFKLYSDIKGDLSNENRLFIQVESLNRLANRASYDYIILDEIEGILRQASPGTTHRTKNKDNYKSNMDTFQRLITSAKYVIGMDAFISNRSIDMFNYLRKNDTKTFIRNNYNPYKRQAIEVPVNQLFTLNLEQLQKKKRCITISSGIKKLQGFETVLNEQKISYHSYHSEDSKTLRKASLQDVNKSWAEVDAILYTSSVSVGINYDNKEKPFSQIFMNASAGGSIPRDLFQGSLRARTLTENLLTFSIDERTPRPQGCNTEEISLMIEDKNQAIVEYLKGWDITEYSNLTAWNKSVILRNKAEDNISRYEYRRVFNYYLEKCGYTASYTEYCLEELILPVKGNPLYDNINDITIDEKVALENKIVDGEDITDDEKFSLDKYYFRSLIGRYYYLLENDENKNLLYTHYWGDKHQRRRRLINLLDELRFDDTKDKAWNVLVNSDSCLELVDDKPLKIRAIKSLQHIIVDKATFNDEEFRELLKNKETFNKLKDIFKTFNMIVESDVEKNSNIYYAKKIQSILDSWSYDCMENKVDRQIGARGKRSKIYRHKYRVGALRKIFQQPKPTETKENSIVSNVCLIVDEVDDIDDTIENVVEPEPEPDAKPTNTIYDFYDFDEASIEWLNALNKELNKNNSKNMI